jgi:MFS family permease
MFRIRMARPSIPSSLRNRSLLTLCLAVLAAYMGAGMVGTVRVLYVHSHGGSLAVISAMASAFLVANFVFQYPWGWLSDRWGRRPVILIGLVMQAIIVFSYLLVTDPVLFVVLRFFEGMGAATVLPAARAAIADMVPEESRGEAYGLFTAFFNAGFLLGPALGGFLAVIGYAWVFVLAALVRVIAVVVVLIGLRETRLRRVVTRESDRTSLRSLFTLPLVAAYVLAFGDYLWLGFDLTLAPLWMRQNLGASLPLIGLAYSIWALPSVIVSPLGGRLADRKRRSALVLVGGLGQVPAYVVYILSTTMLPVMVFFGVQACLYAVVSPAVDSHLARSSPPRARGRAQSTYVAIGLIGAFAGATIFTPLYSIDYRLPLIALAGGYAVCVLIGGVLMRVAERRYAPASGRLRAVG